MGTFERYEPPTESRTGISLVWVVALIAVLGVAGAVLVSQRAKQAEMEEGVAAAIVEDAPAESEANPMSPVGTTVGPEASPYAKDARIAELEMQLRDKDFELSRQRSEIESLEARVGQLQEDSERYRAGLDQAVAELNLLRAEIGRLESSSQPGVTVPQRTQGVQPVGAPQVTISTMGAVLVTGFVNNPTRYAARGRIEISLVGSGGVIETRDFLMYIPPGSQERYDITFPGIFPTERIAAQARWVE
jgi:hypothetical protein